MFFLWFSMLSCNSEEQCSSCKECKLFDYNNEQQSLVESVEKNNFDSVINSSRQKDIAQSLLVIKKKYGEQWDFCNCVVKGDSLNKALSNEKLSDEELDKLLLRFDEIDKKCQAFKIVDANRTPKERALHEKKVKKCLKEAGID